MEFCFFSSKILFSFFFNKIYVFFKENFGTGISISRGLEEI